jgi:putative membrane protein insertion efficiency factor
MGLKTALVFLIRSYQAGISPLLPGTCRFSPTCSEYARVAIERHGAARGAWLAVRRLARCHPLGGFGPDPVPGEPDPNTWSDGTMPDRG